MYFKSPADMGLSQTEVDEIVTRLYNERGLKETCPDCAVGIDERHDEGCDVARCTACKGQRLSCDCGYLDEPKGEPDTWTGIWPRIKQAYENKLICCVSGTGEWMFDLNEVARRRL